MLDWLTRRRRRRILETPFPPAWRAHLEANVRHVAGLDAAERAQLEDTARVFIAEKSWEGCGGVELSDEIRVTIAAQACYMILGYPGYHFDEVRAILVYPDAYVVPPLHDWRGGMTPAHDTVVVGLSNRTRQVVLAWAEALAGGRDAADGRNVVFHEFAHQLDLLDGIADGVPPLAGSRQDRCWREVLASEYRSLVAETRHHRAALLDGYGAKHEAEFFAVATECFFERPEEMARRHRRLFEVLRDFYRRDPRPGGGAG